MKTFTNYLLVAGLALTGKQVAAQQLLDNFETTRLVDYPSPQGTIAVVANPGSNGTNSSSNCASFVRDGSQQYSTISIQLKNNLKFASVAAYVAGTKSISLKFRSAAPAGTAIQLVLQNRAKAIVSPYVYPQGNFSGVFNATTTAAANTWETLTFTYASAQSDATVTANDIDQIAMLIAPGTTSSATYYFDDLMGPELSATTPPTSLATKMLLDNFENTRLVDYTGVQGVLNAAAANPGSATGNTSATCASFARDATQQYATISISPKNGAKFGDVSSFTSGAQMVTMKFRSPTANTKVQLVMQNKAKASATPYNYPQGNFGGTFDATSGAAANTWETLTFVYTANPGAADATVTSTIIDQLAVLIAPNTTNNGATYYFDDLTGPSLATVTATRLASTSAAALAPAYPNPAAGRVSVPYSLQKSAVVSLAVYDALGRRTASVFENQTRPAGEYSADFSTASLAPGLYTCRLVVDGAVLSRQLSVQ